jgi:4-hydroxy-tetrahydrodipicolinate synthase
MKQLTGAITALVTPFTSDNSIDIHALKQLVDFQIAGGIDGIVPCGSTGEAATMTPEEYQLVVKTVVEQVSGRVPVVAGAGSNDTQKAILFSRLAKQAGADGLLHVTPFYNKPTVPGLIAHFTAIAKAVDLPIVVYNVPGRTGLNLSSTTTLLLAKKIEQIVAIKEASGSVTQVMEIVKGASKSFLVLSGDDSLTLPFMAVGAMGCISVVSNEVPKVFTKLTHAALENDWQKAKKLHYELFDLMNVNFIETNPIPVKTALAFMGKIKEQFRLPLVSMEQTNKEIVKKVLQERNLI